MKPFFLFSVLLLPPHAFPSVYPSAAVKKKNIPENGSRSLFLCHYHNVFKLQRHFVRLAANSVHTWFHLHQTPQRTNIASGATCCKHWSDWASPARCLESRRAGNFQSLGWFICSHSDLSIAFIGELAQSSFCLPVLALFLHQSILSLFFLLHLCSHLN